MSALRRTNSKPGQYTATISQYKGSGVTRSCARCTKHGPTAGMRMVKPYGLCCAECAKGKA